MTQSTKHWASRRGFGGGISVHDRDGMACRELGSFGDLDPL